jgi:CRP-like cAMP-binding protein
MQSEPGNEMYRIVTGSVRMSVLRRDGREVLYLVLEPGDCFGIDSLLDGAPRPHTAIASGSVELQVLRRDMYERIRCHHASVSDGMIHLISRHVRLLSEYFVSATLDELSCRVAQRLLQAHEQSTNSVGRAVGPTVRLTQGEIALMVGATRQSVNKVLKSFQDEGFISIEYGRVQVLDIARLRSATLALARPDRDEFQMEDAQEAAQSDPSQDDYPMPRVSLVSRGICVRTPPQGPGSVEADATPGLTTTRYR